MKRFKKVLKKKFKKNIFNKTNREGLRVGQKHEVGLLLQDKLKISRIEKRMPIVNRPRRIKRIALKWAYAKLIFNIKATGWDLAHIKLNKTSQF